MPIYDFDLRLCLNVRKIAVRVTKNAQPAAMRADYDVSRSRFNLSLRRGNIPSYIQSRAGVREPRWVEDLIKRLDNKSPRIYAIFELYLDYA